jgi:hypothetical protein
MKISEIRTFFGFLPKTANNTLFGKKNQEIRRIDLGFSVKKLDKISML